MVAGADQDPPPRRFIAGADALALAERKVAELQQDIDDCRESASALAFEPDAEVSGDE